MTSNTRTSFVVAFCCLCIYPIVINGFPITPNFFAPRSVLTEAITSTKLSSSLNNQNDCDVKKGGKSLLPKLLSDFQGDFDNYHQVYSDRQRGLLPRQGGGHEHFHATLIPINIQILPDSLFPVETEEISEERCGAVIAAYYFDGMPSRIFRLRVYTLYWDENSDDEDGVKMKLFTCDPSLEGKLRSKSASALEDWGDIIEKHVSESKGDMTFQEMERCDILWTSKPDAIRHQYLESFSPATKTLETSEPVHAIMVNDHEKGGVLLESQMMPGSYIRVQDELSLWENELWINDRGHDADSGDMVYGNWDGVPYQMTRVARLNSDLKREVVDGSISWTMGEAWRSEAEYESKMASIGGISTKMNSGVSNKK